MWFTDFPWADAGAVAFAFVVGAMLGSFLNVVAHRVPVGESVVFGRSRCPHCRAPVRPRDNVPILSWLLLRGRCRDCGGPIAPRYAIVEAACGGLVALIVAADLAAGTGLEEILEGGDHRTAVRVVLHVWLVTTLLSWGLLAATGRPVGTRTWLCAMLIAAGGALVVALPDANLWRALSDRRELLSRIAAPGPAVARLVGSGVAWLIGRRLGVPGTERALALAAFACGWQTVPILTVVTLLLQRGCSWATGCRWPGQSGRPADVAGETDAGVVRSLSVPVAVVVAVVMTVACGTAASDDRRFSTATRHPLATGVIVEVKTFESPQRTTLGRPGIAS